MKKILISFIAVFAFYSCAEKSEINEEQMKEYSKKGQEIVAASFQTLKGHLVSSMQSGGLGNAIGYCNENAFTLMDSLSTALGAKIKRTTLKVRNPKDKPDETETKALNTFLEMLHAGKKLSPIVKQLNDEEMAYYHPILIDNPVCLQCHGEIGTTLNPDIYETIKEFYPNDEAIGYKLGDFRGMWSVTLPIK